MLFCFKGEIYYMYDLFNQYDVDAIFIDNPIDIYYMTSLFPSSGLLILTQKGSQLFVDGRYLEECQGSIALCEENILDYLATLGKIQQVGFDKEVTLFSKWQWYSEISTKASFRLKPLNAPIKQKRAIKTENEIEKLDLAAKLNDQSFQYIEPLLKDGCSEAQISIALKTFWIQQGADKPSFEPIIAFGANSSKPHHRASLKILNSNEIALIDIGVTLNHFVSDKTCTYLRNCHLSELNKIYKIVEEALFETLLIVKDGLPLNELDKKARSIIEKYGYAKQFMHSIGHGIGLEIHEYPQLKPSLFNEKETLKKGMCITIEPGIYLEGIGGVRLEKSLVVLEKGYQILGKF